MAWNAGTDANWDSVGYTQSFDTKSGEWHTVKLPFRDFKPIFRARTVPGGPPLDASSVRLPSIPTCESLDVDTV